MTPERTQQLMPVMQAHAEGKPIRSRLHGTNTWVRCIDPTWYDDFDYEVEPKPREWWLNAYDWGHCLHKTNELAEKHKMDNCVETIHLREVIE
jgi:hypothetical protein